MNRALCTTRSRYLVFMDDDVIVTPGWLSALVAEAQKKKYAIVGAVHRYTNGVVHHTGGFICVNGAAAHFKDIPSRTVTVPYVCSAVMLIDVAQITQAAVAFDEQYEKYYHDTDFCLQAWRNGLPVACTPKCDIIHLETATTKQPRAYHVRDLRRFQNKWIARTRLMNLLRTRAGQIDCGGRAEVNLFDRVTKKYNEASRAQQGKHYARAARMFTQVAASAQPLKKYSFGRDLMVGAYFHLGEIYMYSSSPQAAERMFRNALRVVPTHVCAAARLKRLLAARDDNKKRAAT
jgi:glycosyltransferase involved in cell wall biosynthesis